MSVKSAVSRGVIFEDLTHFEYKVTGTATCIPIIAMHVTSTYTMITTKRMRKISFSAGPYFLSEIDGSCSPRNRSHAL